MRNGWLQAGCLIGLAVLSGCVGFLPVPTTKYTPRKYGTRGEIESNVLRFLHSGPATRTDVLLNLGEPDLRWDDDRYFAYRWITARGRLVAWGVSDHEADAGSVPISKRRHDLVIEFDRGGAVRRYGDIRKWTRGPERRLPVDLAEITLDVVHVLSKAEGGGTDCTLRLGESLELECPDAGGDPIRIAVGDVRAFHYQSKQDAHWKVGTFHCRLKHRSGDNGTTVLKIDLDLTQLPLMIDYLRTRSPGARITS